MYFWLAFVSIAFGSAISAHTHVSGQLFFALCSFVARMGKSKKKLKRKLAKLLEAFDSSSSSSSSDDLWETATLSLAIALQHATGSGFSENREIATEPAENIEATTLPVQSASSQASEPATSSRASLTRCVCVCLFLSYCFANYKTFVGLVKQTIRCAYFFILNANSKIMFDLV